MVGFIRYGHIYRSLDMGLLKLHTFNRLYAASTYNNVPSKVSVDGMHTLDVAEQIRFT